MKTIHAIVSQFAKDETKVNISRRELAKIRAELKRPTHHTSTQRLMAHPRTHETKCYWPVRDETFVLETKRNTADTIKAEHPMVTARRRQFPKTR